MDFFKSVFSESPPDSPKSPSSPDPHPSETLTSDTSPQSTATPRSPFAAVTAAAGAWSFGGLIQTLSTKSESVLETYRRDLQEFSTGLKNETQVLKHVAATSLDVGAAKAQVSLESVGLAIDSLGSAVSDIIFHSASDTPDHSPSPSPSHPPPPSDVKYSRFEAQLKAIQNDDATFLEDPMEDGDKGEFQSWKLGFKFSEFAAEAADIMGRKDCGVKGVYDRLVIDSGVVDPELFWLRYFYRVDRLKKAELVRTRLVKRAIEADSDDEDLSWDVDEDEVTEIEKKDDVTASVFEKKDDVNVAETEKKDDVNVAETEKKDDVNVAEIEKKDDVDANVAEIVKKDDVNVAETEKKDAVTVNVNVAVAEIEKEGEGESGVGEQGESSKDSDISVVSRPASSHEEEDMGWDEIEDIGESEGDDEKKEGSNRVGSPSRAELRKRLSAAEEDEDLSWDIEDDDEPIKS